jgi:hypothetical protein
MQIYAVFLPSGLLRQPALEEAKLVRQGFDWGAFLLTPIWALRNSLWLALTLWICWMIVSGAIGALGHLNPDESLAVYELGALFFGLEADRFKAAKLSRAGFLLSGLSLGESAHDAESLYFNRIEGMSDHSTPPLSSVPPVPGTETPAPQDGTDLLGLFSPPEIHN